MLQRENLGSPTAEEDDGDALLGYGIRQLENRFAIQADVKQRSVNVFELPKPETLADTLEWTITRPPAMLTIEAMSIATILSSSTTIMKRLASSFV